MRSSISNWRIGFLIVALLFAAGFAGSSLNANGQEPNQRIVQDESQRHSIFTARQDITSGAADEPEAAPSNDMFANATTIPGSSGSIAGTNVDATVEAGEPNVYANYKTVWYKWTAPANLSMTFETAPGTLTDTLLGVYLGSAVNSLTTMGWNDDLNGYYDRCSRVTFIAHAGTTYRIQIGGFGGDSGTFHLNWTINGAESWKQFNFDGNVGSQFSDYAVFRPASGMWWIWGSASSSTIAHQWGLSSDNLVPGDYDGDTSTDVAVWRSSTGTFYILRSVDSTVQAMQWGLSGDRPVQADFDGDDKADIAIWRPSTGTFWVHKSSTGESLGFQWGISTDYLACGDYDGDGKTDFGIQRNVGGYGYFYIYRSSNSSWYATQFGLASDVVVPGDFDFDGKSDIAVYRYSTHSFYFIRSSDNGFRGYQWGLSVDYVVPGDYVGNYGTDLCVWRPTDGNFYCLDPLDGGTYGFHWGMNGDYPVANSNVH